MYFYYQFWAKNSFFFWKNFGGVLKTEFYASRGKNWGKNCFLKKVQFFIILRHWAKNFCFLSKNFGGIVQTAFDLSRRKFWGKTWVLENVHFSLSFSDIQQNFWFFVENFLNRVSKLHSTSLWEYSEGTFFPGKHLFFPSFLDSQTKMLAGLLEVHFKCLEEHFEQNFSFRRTCFFYRLCTLKKIFGLLAIKIWQGCHYCLLSVQKNIFRKDRKNIVILAFPDAERRHSAFCAELFGGLVKTSLDKSKGTLWEKEFFWSNRKISMFWDIEQ